MYTKKPDGRIVFYYSHADIFDDVQHISAYMCKNIASKEGGNLSEEYAITDDEKDIFGVCLRDTMPNIYDLVRPLTHGLENACVSSMTGEDLQGLSGVGTEGETYAVVVTVDHGAYNPNDPGLADAAILSAIEQGVISEYYTKAPAPDITKLSAELLASSLMMLTKRLLPLRRRSVIH